MQDNDSNLLVEAFSKVYLREGSLEDWHNAKLAQEGDAQGLKNTFEKWFIENFGPADLRIKEKLWFAFQQGTKYHPSGNKHIDV